MLTRNLWHNINYKIRIVDTKSTIVRVRTMSIFMKLCELITIYVDYNSTNFQVILICLNFLVYSEWKSLWIAFFIGLVIIEYKS